MNDLVERLRATDGTLDITTILDRCTEAADEIERLRRRIEQLEFIIADMARRRDEA